MLVQLLPQGPAEKHMGCLLTLGSTPLLRMHFADHSATESVHNGITGALLNMWSKGSSGCPLQPVLIPIRHHSVLKRSLLETDIIPTIRNLLMRYLQRYKPEMQPHSPPGEDPVLYMCLYTSAAQTMLCLQNLARAVWRDDGSPDTDKGDWLRMPVHKQLRGGSVIEKF